MQSWLIAGGWSLVLIGLSSPAVGPQIDVPRGAPVVIDGKIDAAEWDGAANHRFADGSVIRLRHDGRHLFLGLTSTRKGFPSVCIARGDVVRILHASAALGSVTYDRSADGWIARETEFAYGMRSPDLTEQARGERLEYLSRHGWVGSTFQMGDGQVQELQIALDLLSTTPRLALGYFATAPEKNGTVIPWPDSLRADDGCANAELVRGNVPRQLRFEPAEWATLKLAS
jgi:hypothetical protein